MDLNQDGKPDVCFYQGTAPGNVSGVTYINVSPMIGATKNPQTLEQGTYGNLRWLENGDADRLWNEFRSVYPIPFNDLQLNPKLKQNFKWDEIN